nr:hypothetical protein arx11 [uncultured bacterium]
MRSQAGDVLDIVLDGKHPPLPSPDPRPAGEATFRVSTPDASGHKWGLVRLPAGTDLGYFLDCLNRSRSWDPAVHTRARAELNQAVDFAGGVTVYPSYGQIEHTLCLEPGTYYFLDYDDLAEPDAADRIQSLRTTGPARHELKVPVDVVIEARQEGEREFYAMPERLPAECTVLLRNLSDHPQEVVFNRVHDGTTADDVRDFVLAFRTGGTPPGNVFMGAPTGLMPISSGRESAMRLRFPPGRYAVCSYTSHGRTGRSGVLEEMLEIVTIG